jgi:hypothetical protein
MPEASWLQTASPAFRLMIATSWLAPASWQAKQEEAIREAIAAGMDWMEYIRLVDRHRTPALSWTALKRVPGLEIPEPARQELQKRSEDCRMQAVRHCLLLVGALKNFNRAGIPVMTLKGPILSSELYGDIGLRQSHDLDLVCALEDISRAQACLEKIGWRLDSTWFPLSPRQWDSLLRHEHDLGFVHSHGDCILELHWRNTWDPPGLNSARWARSIPSIWQGCSHQAMNPIDQVLYLCSHGGGQPHAWSRAKWLGDLARVHAEGKFDWAAALGEARRIGQERALLACLRLLDLAYGIPLPDLPGDPWKNLPSLLIEIPLHALKAPEQHVIRISMATLRSRLRMSRYERLLLPRKSWRDSLSMLLYRREDFRMLRLPDGLFWAYAPLHPILWAWRWMRRGQPIGDL